jgi:hypothetical protein
VKIVIATVIVIQKNIQIYMEFAPAQIVNVKNMMNVNPANKIALTLL